MAITPSYDLPPLRSFRGTFTASRFGPRNLVAEGGFIASADFDDLGSPLDSTVGWYIGGDGLAVFNAMLLRGYLPSDGDGELEAGATLTIAGDVRSANFVAGSAGWRIRGNGNVEFNDGVFRGSLDGADGTFTGALVAGSIDIPDTTTADSFHVSSAGAMWSGATTFSNASFRVSSAGVARVRDAASGFVSLWSATDGLSLPIGSEANAETISRLRWRASNGTGSALAQILAFLEGGETHLVIQNLAASGPREIQLKVSGTAGLVTFYQSSTLRGEWGSWGLRTPRYEATSLGSQGAPAFRWDSRDDSGMYAGANFVALSSGGAWGMYVNDGRQAFFADDIIHQGASSSGVAGDPCHYGGVNNLYKFTSSRRVKHDIVDLVESVIDLVRPVTFRPNEDPGNIQVGFIAEEVVAVDGRLGVFDNHGEVSVYNERGLMAHLVLYCQQLEARVTELEGAAS
jgi:hypothetical protein